MSHCLNRVRINCRFHWINKNVFWCFVIYLEQNCLLIYLTILYFFYYVFSIWPEKCSSGKQTESRWRLIYKSDRILQVTPSTWCFHALFIPDTTINACVLQLRNFLTLETNTESLDASFINKFLPFLLESYSESDYRPRKEISTIALDFQT